MPIERRVYCVELQRLTGFSGAWIRTLERRGTIPMGNRDPGGRRKWWTESVAREIVEGLSGAKPRAAAAQPINEDR